MDKNSVKPRVNTYIEIYEFHFFRFIVEVYWAKVIMQLCFILIISLFISPKRKFNQSSTLLHNGFNNLFSTVQEKTFYGSRVVEKNEMHGDVPVSDAFRAS